VCFSAGNAILNTYLRPPFEVVWAQSFRNLMKHRQ
jgi:hypothetical protein